jgi:hypothetical protein
MDKASGSRQNIYIAPTFTHQHESHATQTSNDVTEQFGRFSIAETDAEPKIPEAKTEDAEQSTRISTVTALTVDKQKQQKIMANMFSKVFLDLIKKTAINPSDMREAVFIPCIKDNTFFLSISPHVNALIKETHKNSLNFEEIIDAIIDELISSNINITLTIMCDNLLNSAKQYEQQKQQLSLFLGLNSEEGKQYIENIYKLFIEGDTLYNSYYDFNTDTNNCGPYVFENEKGYLNNCLTALFYTLEELFVKNEQLTLQVVSNVIKIFNSGINKYGKAVYTSFFLQSYSSWTAKLIAQGKIAKYIIIDETFDKSNPEEDIRITKHYMPGLFKVESDKSLVEDHINERLGENTSIALKQSEEDSDYYIVDTIKETKDDEINITSTSDISDRQACIFETMYNPAPAILITKISFDKTYKADEYIKSLIDTFNNETTQTQTDLEYVTSLMKFAGSLQRAHIYKDANGRLTYFNLVPALLIKRGLWLTRQPFNLWLLIDAVPPEELAKEYLDLCIQMSKILPNKQHD